MGPLLIKQYACDIFVIRLLTHQKLRIKKTKDEKDRIINMFNLSFSISEPNNRFDHNMIVLSHSISLSCTPNEMTHYSIDHQISKWKKNKSKNETQNTTPHKIGCEVIIKFP